jgi:transcriptional regulator with XRE-family HTH domain
MCPPEPPRKPRKKPVTRGRATNANWVLMDRLEAKRIERGFSLRHVAREMGQHSASRVGAYLGHKIVPGPDIIRRLSLAIGISPIDALWQAKHFDAVFDYFEKLYRLGWTWMREDGVGLDAVCGVSFGIPHWEKGRKDLSGVPPKYAHRYHEVAIYNQVRRKHIIALPKPLAYAMLLAVGLFLRRGDQLRPEVEGLIIQLTVLASEILPQTQIARGSTGAISPHPFKEAARVLPRGYTSRHTRLAIVSEHVQSWCDIVCIGYAQYARLALYRQGGFVGKPEAIEDIWEWQTTDPLSLADLRWDPTKPE